MNVIWWVVPHPEGGMWWCWGLVAALVVAVLVGLVANLVGRLRKPPDPPVRASP